MNDWERQCAECTESSEQLLLKYREHLAADGESIDEAESAAHGWIATIHYRGGIAEFELGRDSARWTDPLDRGLGAQVLPQLGWERRTFHAESIALLIELLDDSDEWVIAEAAIGLRHRHAPEAIPHALRLLGHDDWHVRFGAVFALMGRDTPEAIKGLIRLSGDSNDEVRDYAAFSLGAQTDHDSPPLRDALARLLDDAVPGIREEAMCGLARRRDPRALPAIEAELRREISGSWCLEAAEILANPSLIPRIEEARAKVPVHLQEQFERAFQKVLKACQAQS